MPFKSDRKKNISQGSHDRVKPPNASSRKVLKNRANSRRIIQDIWK